MDTYLSTYMKDYVWHNKPPADTKDESGEPAAKPCPHCGCVCTECPQPVEEEAKPAAPVHDDEACLYLRKLRDKYPFLFQVLSQLPPEDMIVRLYHDRLRTGHPSELCREEKPAPDTGQQGGEPSDGQARGTCHCPKPPPCRTEPAEPREPVVTGRTEYQDTIGATGARIMVEMLPYRKGKKAQQH